MGGRADELIELRKNGPNTNCSCSPFTCPIDRRLRRVSEPSLAQFQFLIFNSTSLSQPRIYTTCCLYHCDCLIMLYRMMLTSLGFKQKPMAAPASETLPPTWFRLSES